MVSKVIVVIFYIIFYLVSCSAKSSSQPDIDMSRLERATFGGGCFWCVESIFENTKGVYLAISGYSGGSGAAPSYEDVSSGRTGYAEVVQIGFDPRVISYEKLLTIFWGTHDPTTLNRQGNDIGPQYRSMVFYHNDVQRESAERIKKVVQAWYKKPIVTEIVLLKKFYKAEEYHQDYCKKNPYNSYCAFVVKPKLEKFKKKFKDSVKVD